MLALSGFKTESIAYIPHTAAKQTDIRTGPVDIRAQIPVTGDQRGTVYKAAAGNAVGSFAGMVYIAQDAQRTDAQQQSRNLLLNDTARIFAQPQLEIYADDVKCSHGATVGQLDDEAIYYMRQRGLSEKQARRLQIEGFAYDVVQHCGCQHMCRHISELTAAKLEKM